MASYSVMKENRPQASRAWISWTLVLLAHLVLFFISYTLNQQQGVSQKLLLQIVTVLSLFVGLTAVGLVAQNRRDFIPAALLFTVSVLFVEAMLRVNEVPAGLIPTPSRVVVALYNAREVLMLDVFYTFVLEALIGFVAGIVIGVLASMAVARYKFLELGILPYASIFSSIPIVALAPVMVKAIGLEWPSKAAVVAVTVIFPIIVNVVRGLQSASPLHLDLMRSYGASPMRVFFDVRVPTAMPYFFNALKISTTLSLISAIVAEFFGTTGNGLGFRIQIEAGRFNFDIVWAAIVVASVIGIVFFSLIGALERKVTGWHASYRS
ncbi:ABC transporter permease [Deinococcus cellulosilyticus]|uniref:ABC transporter permease n=1 Tax=Deinococcus cellulosilyticus (strain DSM 18568 / NBRC 106333 / KACC 11606 / 5516J-15) TaxID=1223518 RepID=A0A511MVV3_DEIC1|nr:ABC transporter permease [Deinococcus cellulosilyticus]GEM44702.1 ABC transporter permease [Deinococcus cellulosilyticus NBRC 106333 = KACC 11606]